MLNRFFQMIFATLLVFLSILLFCTNLNYHHYLFDYNSLRLYKLHNISYSGRTYRTSMYTDITFGYYQNALFQFQQYILDKNLDIIEHYNNKKILIQLEIHNNQNNKITTLEKSIMDDVNKYILDPKIVIMKITLHYGTLIFIDLQYKQQKYHIKFDRNLITKVEKDPKYQYNFTNYLLYVLNHSKTNHIILYLYNKIIF